MSSEKEHKAVDTEAIVYSREEHCLSRSDIDPDALKIMYRLLRHDYKAYLVGGGVRDLLLGKKPKDFDIATDATPRKIKSLFHNSRIIGRRFKLVHVFFRNQKIIEVSTFRAESEDDDEESFGDNVYGDEASDAFRRDLSINALYYDLSNFSIIDYVGGVKDLQDKVVRVIGDPKVRYEEDPVRLIRTIRHAARNRFTVDPEHLSILCSCSDLILSSPSMRVFEEMKKDLLSGSLRPILLLMGDTPLLNLLLPSLSFKELKNPSSALSQTLRRLDNFRRKEEEIPLTSILCALALLASIPEGKTELFLEAFPNRKDVNDFCENAFSKLAVPRKERERMSDTLSLFVLLLKKKDSSLKTSQLRRRRMLPETYWLFVLLQGKQKDRNLLAQLLEASSQRGKDSKGPRRKRSSRRKTSSQSTSRKRTKE